MEDRGGNRVIRGVSAIDDTDLFDNLQLSIANTDYTDLPYQVSTTTGAGFATQSIVVDQTSRGAELESTWAATDNFRLHATVGYIDADVDDPNPAAVAPLTPELTASLSPELTIPAGSGSVTLRADWSFRDDMYGEPSNDPARFTFIESRDLINADISYRPTDGDWTVGIYGRNITDERYHNARLNTCRRFLRELRDHGKRRAPGASRRLRRMAQRHANRRSSCDAAHSAGRGLGN